MKYLMITPWCPYPPYKNGGVNTIYNIIKNTPNNIQVDLLYYAEKDEVAEKEIVKYVSDIFYVPMYSTKKSNRIISLLRKRPDILSGMRMNLCMQDMDFSQYSCLILDQIISLEILDMIPKDILCIGMMHDNQILMYKRKKEKTDSLLKKAYYSLQCKWLKKTENKYYKYLKKIVYVSKLDADIAHNQHSNLKDTIFDSICLGVDIPNNERISKVKQEHSMVFSGILDYPPNEDAALYLMQSVFPEIKKIYPDACLTIVGKNPTSKILSNVNEGIVVTGFVDDLIKAITESSIYVSPLGYGTGTKNKVLEAMSAGMPVMVSSVSREGIEGLKNGENCIFINEENIINEIINLFEDSATRMRVAKNGRYFVQQHHSWKNVFKTFEVV